jgi:predicted ester cyclase
MSTESTRQFIEQYVAALSGSDKSPELVAQFVTDDSLRRHIEDFEKSFPGYDLEVDDMVVEGDKVVLRATFSGVHQDEFQGIQATGREVTLPVMLMYRIEHGKIAEFWMSADSLSLLQQLGAVAVPA